MREMTIAGFQAALQNGTLTCTALVEYYLDRIERNDKGPNGLNAVIRVHPDAPRRAWELDEMLREGARPGPLHGVPVILKDNIETFDLPTTAGSRSLSSWRSGRDAFLAQRLRQAGALILAKANLHEFAIWGESVSSVLGQTKNPYDPTRTPGGSSGGTGAAIAADFGLAGIGTDTVNSVRSPASACCLCGIRPTVGLVSRGGIVPYSLTQDTAGPMTRTLEDAVRVLTAISGYDPGDRASAPLKNQAPVDYAAFLNPNGLRGKRLGVVDRLFGGEGVHREVNAVMDACLTRMKDAGAAIEHLDEPLSADALTKDVSVHLYDLAEHLCAYLSSFGSNVPVHSVEEILQSGLYTPDIEENLQRALLLQKDVTRRAQHMQRRALVQNQILSLMDKRKLDALVYPHQKRLVCRIGDSQRERNGVLAAATGFPAITVPGGFSAPDANAPLGVPIGAEFMGRPFLEGPLIEIAYGFEQTTRARLAPRM